MPYLSSSRPGKRSDKPAQVLCLAGSEPEVNELPGLWIVIDCWQFNVSRIEPCVPSRPPSLKLDAARKV